MASESSINSDLIRGHIDTIILGMLIDSDSYGYEICKRVTTLSEGAYELKETTLYSASRRLEQQKLISSYWGEGSQGARRKYYRITDLGRDAYKRNLDEWHKAQRIIERLLSRSAGGEEK